jgi:hypothetical protein
MRNLAFVVAVVLAPVSHTGAAEAQELRGFLGASTVSDLNEQHFPALGGGVLLHLPTPWITAGAQAEMMISWPYVAGRGAVFGQVNVLRRRPVTPFVLLGIGFGESAGPMVGGGVDLRPWGGRMGLRVNVEDYLARVEGFDCAAFGYTRSVCDTYLHGGDSYFNHQLSLRVALLF